MHTFFLGANTGKGFFSLYDRFPPEGAFLHVIKSGPGTGKSSLMRRIGQAAEARGLAVQRVLCSGDPDSLDGVFLPDLGLAWADGTAPHVLEPTLLGVTGDYLELGSFLSCPFSAREKAELLALREAYQEKYRQAYGLLADCANAGGLREKKAEEQLPAQRLDRLKEKEKAGTVSQCFRSAISCKGFMRSQALEADWERLPTSAESLRRAKERALEKGYELIDCLHPLDPTVSEAILLPEERVCLELATDPPETAKLLLDRAVTALRETKAIHDRMELRYREHMDFEGLSAMTERLLAKLFS